MNSPGVCSALSAFSFFGYTSSLDYYINNRVYFITANVRIKHIYKVDYESFKRITEFNYKIA